MVFGMSGVFSANSYQISFSYTHLGLSVSEDECAKSLRNVGSYIPENTALQWERSEVSAAPL
jgi:hypothetical protein